MSIIEKKEFENMEGLKDIENSFELEDEAELST